MFPVTRPRRLRRTEAIRDLVRQTRVGPEDLVYPLFVVHGKRVRNEISAMPGNFHLSVDELLEEVGQAHEEGIRSVLLFGIPERKDELGSEAYHDSGAVQNAVRASRSSVGSLSTRPLSTTPQWP